MNIQVHGLRAIPSVASIPVAGYKHSNVLLMAAAILSPETVRIDNVPNVLDTRNLVQILRGLGARVTHRAGSMDTEGHMRIEARDLEYGRLPEALTAPIHGAMYLLPAVLGRFGRCDLGATGGCQIGAPSESAKRPLDHMISVLERFGASHRTVDGRLEMWCDRLRAADIDMMDYSDEGDELCGPRVSGATKTAILAAVAAHGRTVIRNPHYKEAVADLVGLLAAMGVEIERREDFLAIVGRPSWRAARYRVMSDTTEMVTFMAAAAYLRRPIRLTRVTVKRARHWLSPELDRLHAMGVRLTWGANDVIVKPPQRMHAADVEACSTGLSTDSHPFYTLLMAAADGVGHVSDRVWKHRFNYVRELCKLGADMRVDGHTVTVSPSRPHRSGMVVEGCDTRAAAVLVLAALGIPGTTRIRNVEHIDRGYQDFYLKLRRLGAVVHVVDEATGLPQAA